MSKKIQRTEGKFLSVTDSTNKAMSDSSILVVMKFL